MPWSLLLCNGPYLFEGLSEIAVGFWFVIAVVGDDDNIVFSTIGFIVSSYPWGGPVGFGLFSS